MASNPKNVFKEFYLKLLEVLPTGHLISQFYSRNLLSDVHKCKLDALTNEKERAEYFLDKVIKPGLQIDYTKQFDEMLLIMQSSDDPPVKYLADEVKKVIEQPEASLGMSNRMSRLHFTDNISGPGGPFMYHLCCHKWYPRTNFARTIYVVTVLTVRYKG